jgi:hypothetical protein
MDGLPFFPAGSDSIGDPYLVGGAMPGEEPTLDPIENPGDPSARDWHSIWIDIGGEG